MREGEGLLSQLPSLDSLREACKRAREWGGGPRHCCSNPYRPYLDSGGAGGPEQVWLSKCKFVCSVDLFIACLCQFGWSYCSTWRPRTQVVSARAWRERMARAATTFWR